MSNIITYPTFLDENANLLQAWLIFTSDKELPFDKCCRMKNVNPSNTIEFAMMSVIRQAFVYATENIKYSHQKNKNKAKNETKFYDYLSATFGCDNFKKYKPSEIFFAFRNSISHNNEVGEKPRMGLESDGFWKVDLTFNRLKENEENFSVKASIWHLFKLLLFYFDLYPEEMYNVKFSPHFEKCINSKPFEAHKHIQLRLNDELVKWDPYQQLAIGNYFKLAKQAVGVREVVVDKHISFCLPVKRNYIRNMLWQLDLLDLLFAIKEDPSGDIYDAVGKLIRAKGYYDEAKLMWQVKYLCSEDYLFAPIVNTLFTLFCSRSETSIIKMLKRCGDIPEVLKKEDGKLNNVLVLNIRNSLNHGTFFKNHNQGVDFYDANTIGQQTDTRFAELQHVATMNYADITHMILAVVSVDENYKNKITLVNEDETKEAQTNNLPNDDGSDSI